MMRHLGLIIAAMLILSLSVSANEFPGLEAVTSHARVSGIGYNSARGPRIASLYEFGAELQGLNIKPTIAFGVFQASGNVLSVRPISEVGIQYRMDVFQYVPSIGCRAWSKWDKAGGSLSCSVGLEKQYQTDWFTSFEVGSLLVDSHHSNLDVILSFGIGFRHFLDELS